MKIRLVDLRRLINEALQEEGIAIATIGDESNAYIIAYKVPVLEELLSNPAQSSRLSCVVAGVWGSRKSRLGNCNDAAVVKKSVSGMKGWGTKVYLAAIDFFGSLAPDRESVSDSALGMWKSLVSKGFVVGEEFDDIEMPWTEPEEDDCKLHNKNPGTLNNSYKLQSGLPSEILEAVEKGRRHMTELGSRGLSDKATKVLKDGFNSLFLAKY